MSNGALGLAARAGAKTLSHLLQVRDAGPMPSYRRWPSFVAAGARAWIDSPEPLVVDPITGSFAE